MKKLIKILFIMSIIIVDLFIFSTKSNAENITNSIFYSIGTFSNSGSNTVRYNYTNSFSSNNGFDSHSDDFADYDAVAIVDATLTIARIIGTVLAMLIILVSAIKIIAYKWTINSFKYMDNIEENEEYKKVVEKHKKLCRKFPLVLLFAFILFSISGIFGIMRKMSKPIIYLYPEREQKVSVVLENEEILTCTYPKYENSWEVNAKPNGDLTDLKTGRNLYALYWEGKKVRLNNKIEEGFCVKGEDTAKFLEEKLSTLGLSDREAEEFIVYWLPELESNKYNLIRFQTMEEIEKNMPLDVTPKPDSVIRVMMEFKSSNKYVELKEQALETPERKGFVLVEWGGTEL